MSSAGDPGYGGPVEDLQHDGQSDQIRAVIEDHDGDAECTLYPSDADDVTLMSRWMTASDGSFVALAEMR